jgi:hypothetical protein
MLDPVLESDLIFVLAGDDARKRHGLKLFRDHAAKRIILSTGRFEIRRLSQLSLPAPIDLLTLAAPIPPEQRHFFVCFEENGVSAERIPLKRFGTLSEVEALALWLANRSHILSVTIISTRFHLPRIAMCCKALLPQGIHFSLIPTPELDSSGQWYSFRKVRVFLTEGTKELVKILAYWFLLSYPNKRS